MVCRRGGRTECHAKDDVVGRVVLGFHRLELRSRVSAKQSLRWRQEEDERRRSRHGFRTNRSCLGRYWRRAGGWDT